MTDYKRDDDGNLIDPPVIPEYERRLADAHARGDNDAIQAIQAEYDDARDDLADADGDETDDETVPGWTGPGAGNGGGETR